METLKEQIESTQKTLKALKGQYAQVYNSVKSDRESWSYNGFERTCQHILHLIDGRIYRPYDSIFRLWQKDGVEGYALIWSNYGRTDLHTSRSSIGFICEATKLFEATKDYHKDIWIHYISNKKYEYSFKEFCDKLKRDQDFLREAFTATISDTIAREKSVYSRRKDPHLVEFSDRKLKIKKHFVYLTKKL